METNLLFCGCILQRMAAPAFVNALATTLTTEFSKAENYSVTGSITDSSKQNEYLCTHNVNQCQRLGSEVLHLAHGQLVNSPYLIHENFVRCQRSERLYSL